MPPQLQLQGRSWNPQILRPLLFHPPFWHLTVSQTEALSLGWWGVWVGCDPDLDTEKRGQHCQVNFGFVVVFMYFCNVRFLSNSLYMCVTLKRIES